MKKALSLMLNILLFPIIIIWSILEKRELNKEYFIIRKDGKMISSPINE